ncbi:hypothetical protein ACIQZG_19820 [Lysinibacillus sp. NPDC096418]|uniref:hypothetical protein n=1 Tax=Lysinibacillus sp. NPDC096418 TaxID=3364138 RepID=UPI003815B1D0
MRLKQFLLIIVTCSILLIMGCSNNGETEEGEGEFPPSMDGLIIINGIEHQIEQGGYEWERKKGLNTEIVQTDHASPNQMAEHIKSIYVNPNEKIEIKIEGNPDITVYIWNEEGRVKEIIQEENQITAPSNKGKYIYEVLAKWANGTVSYTFILEIQ